MSGPRKVAVIGAGPAGITSAYQLSKNKDIEVELYEAAPTVGGLAKSINLWNQKVDIGPHRFFSSDKQVNSLWLEVEVKITKWLIASLVFYIAISSFITRLNLSML